MEWSINGVILHNLSLPLVPALATDSEQTDFQGISPQGFEPLPLGSLNGIDGVFSIGDTQGTFAPQAILVIPYCKGDVGAQFWMRIWGWYRLTPNAQPSNEMWVPKLLTQMYLTAGIVQGVAGEQVTDAERFVDAGNPDAPDDIYVTLVPLMGAKKIQFDFAHGIVSYGFGNALWARA